MIKKIIKTVVFQVGVDCLGFPLFHKNFYEEIKKMHITTYHENFHKQKKNFNDIIAM